MMESTALNTELEDSLRERLRGKVLLVGIGNPMRGDDGVGPKIIEMLEGKIKAELLDAGEVPESYAGRMVGAQADTIVFLDAADFQAEPGDVAILGPEDLAGASVSTHQMPLNLLWNYLRENSHADVFALGIQALQLGFGEPMSADVWNSAEYLEELLAQLLPKASPVSYCPLPVTRTGS
jgi:hydrogenase 3 maturation protease